MATDFIRDIIREDLRSGRYRSLVTRFPPEPNGYLHIGHAKAICVNFGVAQEFDGTCNLRYDDTNPTKEDVEYVESIERDVRWLGFAPAAVVFSADYFPRMYELAERLVHEGLAYVCELDDEQIRVYRGTLSEPGRPSPNRDASVEDNLRKLRAMKAGELPDGACTLRAKIDMASANMKMRDPLLYRIRHAHHHRTGDQWCIYPMYDWAHPIEDGIEGTTHSICTLEFENNRELYDWVLDHTGPWEPRPHQYEMARLAIDHTVMSKRKLRQLVEGGHVAGWDDPRMPTLAGLRRRGYAPEAIRAFCEMIGVSKANSMVDLGKLEYCVRDELNRNAPRAQGVIRPIEVALDTGARLYIERDDWHDAPPADYKRLGPGRTVRLRHGACITAGEVTARDADGAVRAISATEVPGTADGTNPPDGRAVAGVIHWVDAATAVTAEVRLYDRLFAVARPEEGGDDFLAHLNPRSLEVVRDARLAASFASAEVGSRWQLERVGYFIVDESSRPGALVLNRIITLRDSYAEARPEPVVAAGGDADAERKPSAKAKTRPKSKSPHEYRIEARARDAELAAQHDRFAAVVGAEHADLLAADRATAALFAAVSERAKPDTAAKWIINELPRALAGRELATVDGGELGALLAAVDDGSLSTTVGKALLGELVRGGQSFAALRAGAAAAAAAAGSVDLGPVIDGVLAAHPDKAAQYRGGKTGLLGFFVGQVVRAAPQADPAAVQAAVRERLA